MQEADGLGLREAARKYGLDPQLIRYWIKQSWVEVVQKPEGPGKQMLLDEASLVAAFKRYRPRRKVDAGVRLPMPAVGAAGGGMGLRPPLRVLGSMVSDGWRSLNLGHPVRLIASLLAAAIMVTLLFVPGRNAFAVTVGVTPSVTAMTEGDVITFDIPFTIGPLESLPAWTTIFTLKNDGGVTVGTATVGFDGALTSSSPSGLFTATQLVSPSLAQILATRASGTRYGAPHFFTTGFGYGYGYTTNKVLSMVYRVTANTTGLQGGSYTATANVNTLGKDYLSTPVSLVITVDAPIVQQIVSLPIESTVAGVALQDVTMTSSDGVAAVQISAGTTMVDSQGDPVSEVTVEPFLQSLPAAPSVQNVIGLPYNFGPTGTVFDPSVQISVTVDTASLGSLQLSQLKLAIYNEAATPPQWETLPSCVSNVPASNVFTCSASHFTLFAVVTGAAAPTVAVTATATPAPAATPAPTVTLVETPATGDAAPGNAMLAVLAVLGAILMVGGGYLYIRGRWPSRA